METVSPCPNCGGRTLYEGQPIHSGGSHSPNYLNGLGTFWRPAKFVLVVCRDCGLVRWFAAAEARAKLSESPKWKLVTPSDRGGFR